MINQCHSWLFHLDVEQYIWEISPQIHSVCWHLLFFFFFLTVCLSAPADKSLTHTTLHSVESISITHCKPFPQFQFSWLSSSNKLDIIWALKSTHLRMYTTLVCFSLLTTKHSCCNVCINTNLVFALWSAGEPNWPMWNWSSVLMLSAGSKS